MRVLLTTYYNETYEARRREQELCLQLNMASFDRIVVLAEKVDRPHWFNGAWRSESERPAYRNLLTVARRSIEPSDLVVIANCDIIFTKLAVNQIDDTLQPMMAYCLTRWEMEGRNTMKVWDVGYSQDAWCMRGPPAQIGGDYWFGVPGCDNRFSYELSAAGYKLSNPSKSIATYHLHTSHRRTETNNERKRVPPPYLYLPPTELGQEQPQTLALTMDERRRAFSDRRHSRTRR
jgi:hypothetical protein